MRQDSRSPRVVVVGLGHAGCEAALAAARMGAQVTAVTLRRDGVAVMSCNPAIGGTAKGHLVRELDALGGEMALAADRAGTHTVTLNASKGPAVRATRVLCDREAYAAGMRRVVESTPNLRLLEGEVRDLLVASGRVTGVALADGSRLEADAVVLTTGTFLRATLHVGATQSPGGRLGDAASTGLSAALRALGFELGRFKTGTPPRLWARSIDAARTTPQPGEPRPRPFSARTPEGASPPLPRLLCQVTHTTAQTHQVVRAHLHRSPLFRGAIAGRGPRYCPSLEDKVVRFAERDRHTVYLEPEGVTSAWVYPAGLSTSLPPDAQLELLRTIPGLEAVEVAAWGYAVEYDYAPPTQLRPTLETRAVEGLFFAGQLNGTSGYEEAAFQGLLAGANAVLRCRGDAPLVLERREAHGAVLVDELVTRGVDEPFRMMTARSEHRLALREGNADRRLSAHGLRLGLVTQDAHARTLARWERVQAEVERLEASGLAVRLRRPEETYASLGDLDPERPALPPLDQAEVETEVKYRPYLRQLEASWLRRAEAYDGWVIPRGFDWPQVAGLSREARERLARAAPATVGQARRLPGLTPAAVGLVLVHLRRTGASP